MEKIAVNRFVAKEFQTTEAIKALRTNILFSGADIRSIALTSFTAQEGKSTLSFQIAASLAQTGRKVLLMDGDLRKSVMANRLRVKGKVSGLSHVLSGLCNVKEALCETDVPGLYIMFAGARVPNAAELLGTRSFKTLIAALEDTFDYVIVDAPPLGMVIDCAVIAPVLDGVLMVVNASRNSYKLERRVKAQLEKSGGKILGVVLNRVDLRDKNGYYGRAYGYGGYGYSGYGFTSDEK